MLYYVIYLNHVISCNMPVKSFNPQVCCEKTGTSWGSQRHAHLDEDEPYLKLKPTTTRPKQAL